MHFIQLSGTRMLMIQKLYELCIIFILLSFHCGVLFVYSLVKRTAGFTKKAKFYDNGTCLTLHESTRRKCADCIKMLEEQARYSLVRSFLHLL